MFLHFLLQMPVYLVGALSWVAKHVVGLETPKNNVFSHICNFFLNLYFSSQTFSKETHYSNFNRLCNYLYLFKKKPAQGYLKILRRTFFWSGECSSSNLKMTKMGFSPINKYIHFGTFLCGFLLPVRHPLFYIDQSTQEMRSIKEGL